MRDEIIDRILTYRSIPEWDVCPKCSGIGTVMYGSTSMWRGGIGGAAMTTGPCDKCWGSGRESSPWYSHAEFEKMRRELKKILG